MGVCLTGGFFLGNMPDVFVVEVTVVIFVWVLIVRADQSFFFFKIYIATFFSCKF